MNQKHRKLLSLVDLTYRCVHFSAATTHDITELMAEVARVRQSLSIVSLLQPPPETVANFDELILVADGKIIYR